MRESKLVGFITILLLLQGCTTEPGKTYTCRQYYQKLETLTRNNADSFPIQANPCDSLDSSITPPPFSAHYQVNYYPVASHSSGGQ